MNRGLLFVICFAIAIIIIGVPPALYFELGWFRGLFHDILRWHQPDGSPKWDDGCSKHSKCKWCGKDIMQDGQGNWFSSEDL